MSGIEEGNGDCLLSFPIKTREVSSSREPLSQQKKTILHGVSSRIGEVSAADSKDSLLSLEGWADQFNCFSTVSVSIIFKTLNNIFPESSNLCVPNMQI